MMLDQGQFAERKRRLAVAGLGAAIVLLLGPEPIVPFEKRLVVKTIDELRKYFEEMLEKEPMIKSACENLVETKTTWKIDKNGNAECPEQLSPWRT